MTDICTKAVSSNGQNEDGYHFHKQHRHDVLFRLDSRHVSTIVYPVATVRQARGQVLTTEAPGVWIRSVAMSLACHIGTEKFPTRHHLSLYARSSNNNNSWSFISTQKHCSSQWLQNKLLYIERWDKTDIFAYSTWCLGKSCWIVQRQWGWGLKCKEVIITITCQSGNKALTEFSKFEGANSTRV